MVAQRAGSVECPRQAFEDRVACVAEPDLAVQIVDRDEAACPVAGRYEPVVAAGADRGVLGRLDVEAPAFGESAEYRLLLDPFENIPHAGRA